MNDAVDRVSAGGIRPALVCVGCGKRFPLDAYRLTCDEPHEPALLRSVFSETRLTLDTRAKGVARFAAWLPISEPLHPSSGPISFESEGLAHRLGLKRLFVCFNGYWPERGAHMMTCSFKELEAVVVAARLGNTGKTLVVSSAGNTGRAFAEVFSRMKRRLSLVVPEVNLGAMWSLQPFDPDIELLAVGSDGDYSDAIAVGERVSRQEGHFSAGGVNNVGRRDGMGVTVLEASTALGVIPDHYFQAVGSGSGGIAAWEASQRLRQDSRFGSANMKLHLAQNSPFTPMADAWQAGCAQLLPRSSARVRRCIAQVGAHALTNRSPAYSVRGGVFDALSHTSGHMYRVSNREAEAARGLFESSEGIDISREASVAVAALIQAVHEGTVQPNDRILLNITAGGQGRLFRDYHVKYHLQPALVVHPGRQRDRRASCEKVAPASAARRANG